MHSWYYTVYHLFQSLHINQLATRICLKSAAKVCILLEAFACSLAIDIASPNGYGWGLLSVEGVN